MPLVASIASLVAAMRSRVLDRGACGRLADRRVDAAARRERCWPSSCSCTNVAQPVAVEHDHQGCCWLELGHGHQEPLVHDVRGPAQLARRARPRRRGLSASWAAPNPHPSAHGELLHVIFGADQHVRHVENGLLTIFRLVCGSSAQVPSCWSERRRQTSWAAAAGGLAEWPRAWLLSITACMHLNHSMALASFSLSLPLFRCMRQLRWWRAAARLAPSGDHRRAALGCCRVFP